MASHAIDLVVAHDLCKKGAEMLKFEIRLLLEVGNMISPVSLFTVDDNGVTVLFHRIALLDGGYFFSSERIDAVHLLTCIVSDYAMNIVPVHPANSVPVLFEIDRHNALPSLSRLLFVIGSLLIYIVFQFSLYDNRFL